MLKEINALSKYVNISRGGSRAAATSKMERFMIIVNGYFHKALHLECCSSPRSDSDFGVKTFSARDIKCFIAHRKKLVVTIHDFFFQGLSGYYRYS